MNKVIVIIINVDWYFKLHWVERAKFLQSLGCKVHVVCHFMDLEYKEELVKDGFICHELYIKRSSISPIVEFKTLVSVYNLIKTISPDLIHAVTIKPNIYSGIINRIYFKRPIIYSITGLGIIFSSKQLKFSILGFFLTKLFKFISHNRSCFIFENDDDLKKFNRLGILSNNGVVIFGAGIDTTVFSPSEYKHRKRVLFAARLLAEKGLPELVEAKKILLSRGVDFDLNVAGIIDDDVSSAIPLSTIEKWHSERLINWLGQRDDMPTLIRHNDIVCLPSSYGEGVPRILIEAASCQKPIITTNVPGCRHIVEHYYNGLLVQPGSTTDISEALNLLLNNEDLAKKFGLNGRKKVESEYSQSIVFEKTYKVYKNLIK